MSIHGGHFLQEALQRHFSQHARFRAGQKESIEALLRGQDAVVVMPTGSGKSLCYQLSAMLLPGLTIVISPLIALMKDQVDALLRIGIPATFINSSLSAREQELRLRELQENRYKLVYIAPERLRSETFRTGLRGVQISLLAVDEAHCISQWGHDFRPDYLSIGNFLGRLGPATRVMAVTATATPAVRNDIIGQLALGKAPRTEPFILVQGFARPNLTLHVSRCATHDEKRSHLRTLIKKYHTGIIYCATRKQAQSVYQWLATDATLRKSCTPLHYSGGLDGEERESAQTEFSAAKNPVVVATNAFGMGIDRADLRFIAHWDIPGSIEAYYQEIGRAGRDGKPAFCELLFNYADVRTQEFFMDAAHPQENEVRSLLEVVQNLCHDGAVTCSDEVWAEYAGLKNGIKARICFSLLERSGYLRRNRIKHGETETELLPSAPGAETALRSMLEANRRKNEADHERLRQMLRYVSTRQKYQDFILNYFGEDPSSAAKSAPENTAAPGAAARRTADPAAKASAKPPEGAPLSEERWIVLQKILSCFGRMEGKFSACSAMEVLLGLETEPVRTYGLKNLSTFGLLRDFDPGVLGALISALQEAGCLEFDRNGDFSAAARLTDFGGRVARRRVPGFSLAWPEMSAPRTETFSLNSH